MKKEHPVVTTLKNRGITLVAIGAKYGYSKASMSKALRSPHLAIETIIAKESGLPAGELFPDRYRNGFPIYLAKGDLM